MALEAWWVVTLSLAIAWLMPLLGNRGFCAVERVFTRAAQKKTIAIIGVFFGTIALRVAMIPRFPVPVPFVHDEFAYLLQADMFAHGRLAFPPHPMARYFETIYVIFSPTYSSSYPPAQAALLALGQLVGHPWIGVLLSSAAMSAAILWMLQGWLPAQWALLATILFALRVGVISYWMNSYWGGAVAGAAAALVVGALPRIQKHQKLRDALLMGIGVAVLANSRPLEGLIFCVPVAVAMGAWLLKRWRKGEGLPTGNVLLPLTIVLALLVSFSFYYNWRVTTNPFEIPHALFIKQYFCVPLFIWQNPLPTKNFANPQLHAFFDLWGPLYYNGTWPAAKHVTWKKAIYFWEFFLGVFLCLPLVTFPRVLKDRRTRFLVIQFSLCSACLLTVVWFLPHYAAPMVVTFLALLMQCLRHLRQWKFRGRRVGIGLSRVIVMFSLATIGICFVDVIRNPYIAPYFDLWQPHNWDRAKIIEKLEHTPGEQLVLVRYARKHNIHMEWVYNAADIDHAKIVWAREIPGMDLSSLFAYYPNRKVWVVEPDQSGTPIYPYSGPPLGISSLQ
ncbi:MAG: hypothetical protein WBL50_25575 [Candidatus Acidiferrum sp.]